MKVCPALKFELSLSTFNVPGSTEDESYDHFILNQHLRQALFDGREQVHSYDNKEVSDLKKKVNLLTSALNALTDANFAFEFSTSKEQMIDATELSSDFDSESADLKIEISGLHQKLAQMGMVEDNLNKDLFELKAELTATKQINDKQKSKIVQMSNAEKNLNEELSAVKAELAASKETNSKNTSEIGFMHEGLNTIIIQLSQFKAEMTASHKAFASDLNGALKHAAEICLNENWFKLKEALKQLKASKDTNNKNVSQINQIDSVEDNLTKEMPLLKAELTASKEPNINYNSENDQPKEFQDNLKKELENENDNLKNEND